MKKGYSFDNLSSKRCKCGKQLKTRIIMTKKNPRYCFKCWMKIQFARRNNKPISI